MNEIYELKNEICFLKNPLEDGEENLDRISVIKFYKSEISLLKDLNCFLKSELQQKQIIVEKLLDLQKDQSKINCSNKVHNKHDHSQSNFDNTCLDKNMNTMKNVRKCVEAIRELDNSENIQIGFSNIMHR